VDELCNESPIDLGKIGRIESGSDRLLLCLFPQKNAIVADSVFQDEGLQFVADDVRQALVLLSAAKPVSPLKPKPATPKTAAIFSHSPLGA
jgi:hypothetical protein